MKPERNATRLLSITRSKAKMYEFKVPLEDHINLPIDPNLLFVLAVGLLGDAAAAIASDGAENELRGTTNEALRFAGIYFDAYIESQLDGSIAPEFGVLAAAAYYLSESPGSARVIIRRVALPAVTEQGPLYKLAYSLLLGQPVEIDGGLYEMAPTNLLEALSRFYRLEGSEEALLKIADEIRTTAYEFGSDRDVLYADISVAVCKFKIVNAARTVLPPASDLDLEAWRSAITRQSFPTELWPSQMRICDAGVMAGASAVIQMPTSAGKTRATELVIRSAFLSGRTDLAVIVAPFRALCHDIRGDLAKAFAGENIGLDEATDSYQFDLSFEDFLSRKTVLIVTPEKLLYILRRAPELADKIGLLIYDEGHLFDSASRGVTYELLLTSLKLTVQAHTQILLISAVIENAAAVAGWLVGDQSRVVDGKGMLPTMKSIAFASWRDAARGQLRYVSPLDPDDEEFFVPRVIESVELTKPGTETARMFPMSKGAEIGLYLGIKLVQNGQIAVFCGRKDSAAKLCKEAVALFELGLPFDTPLTVSNAAEVEALAGLISFHLGADSTYAKAARLGIFAHHGNVPHGVRLAIEHAMKEGLTQFVVCTSTLAQGVNLPIRYLIVTSVQQGQDRILVRDFHNLIGRAGRAGMHTEGSVIFASPDIFDQKNVFRQSWRWRAAKELLNAANSEPCGSNILYAFEAISYGRDKSLSLTMDGLKRLLFDELRVTEQIVSQFLQGEVETVRRAFRREVRTKARVIQSMAAYLLAHIDLGASDWMERLTVLVENTLAFHIANDGQKDELKTLFQGVVDALREHAGDPAKQLLIKRSPLPPEGALRVSDWLAVNQARLIDANAGGDLFEVVFEFVSEQAMPDSFKALSDSGIASLIGEMWFDERTYAEIHKELVRLDIRKGGNSHRLSIDDVVGLCENAFGYEVAMIVATMADALEDAGDGLSQALSVLQQKLKYGLDSDAAISFFEVGFADRKIAAELGKAFPAVTGRVQARAAIRQNGPSILELLHPYPAYFSAICREVMQS